jgi:chorismate mutase/prephenate dehydratase
MAKESASEELRALRQRLDQIDEEIVRAMARRLEAVGLIAKAKAGRTQGIRDPEREREVLARVEALAQSLGISAPLARKVFSELINHSLTRQAASLSGTLEPGRPIAVVYQGAPLSYSHLAAQKYLGERGCGGHFVGVPSFKAAVDQLESGAAELAFLPIENTAAGSINQVYDILREHDVHIVGEETFKVDLCLAGTADVPLSTIRRVISHPLALDQCSAFIDALPQVRPVPHVDTADAARLVAEAKDPTQAAISSPDAAAAHGLTILRRGIGNQEVVLMRYVALARTPVRVDMRVPCKTSIILSTGHEQGALVRCLQVLADCGLSMTKIESRPWPNRAWEYMFFIDFEGNSADSWVAAAVDQLRAQSLFLKVLGCYPAKATPSAARSTTVTHDDPPASAATDDKAPSRPGATQVR